MKSFLKYFLVLTWAVVMCTACSSEKVAPKAEQTSTNTNITSRTDDEPIEVTAGAVLPLNTGTAKSRTWKYKAVGLDNSSRTYLTVSDFDAGCSCASAPGVPEDCPRLIIKDLTTHTEIVNTKCMPVNRFIKIPSNEFSVTMTVPNWISWSSDVRVEVMNW